MTLSEVLAAARAHHHLGDMRGSAALAFRHAECLAAAGYEGDARKRALKSLAYSVGVHSPIYQQAAQAEPAR